MPKPDFERYLAALGEVLRERNERYGTQNITGPAGVLARAQDKVARLEQAVAEGRLDPNDWLDLGGYAAVGWLLEHGGWDERSVLRRVYFAHRIDPGSEDLWPLNNAIIRMQDAGFAVYWPRGAFHGAAGQADWIWRVNLEAVRGCDLLVAHLQPDSPGVAAEILAAKIWGKTVWVVAERAGSFVQWAAHRHFPDMDTLLERLKGVAVDGPIR